MILKTTNRFLRDLEKIHSAEIVNEIHLILDKIESAELPQHISGFKSFDGKNGFGRIRISDHKIGVQVLGEEMIFRCMIQRSVVDRNFR